MYWDQNATISFLKSNLEQEVDITTSYRTNQSKLVAATALWKYISDEDRYLIVVIVNCFICIPICVLGVVANIINIAVFISQGFKDSINISLICLAFADLGSLLTLLWRDILYIPALGTSSLPFDPIALIYLTGGMPHVCFVRISGCITAFIAFERCICIAWPLKVKQIFTHARTVAINVVIYLVAIGAVSPVYYTSRLSWKFFPSKNRSLWGLVYTEDRSEVENASSAANGIFLPSSAFIVDLVCTIIMVIKLHSQAKWRKETASTNTSNKAVSDTTGKDVRIMQMVMTLSIIFIVCSLPINVNFIWMLIDEEFSIEGQFANTMLVCATFSFLCEAINSSLNLFVYSKMSSKFKRTFMRLCCSGKSDSMTGYSSTSVCEK